MANEKRLIDVLKYARALEENEYRLLQQFGEYESLRIAIKLITSARNFAMNQPTVDAVEVVHGRCITDKKGVSYCGNCRHIDDYALVHNYCPNCGAKMDGDGNG